MAKVKVIISSEIHEYTIRKAIKNYLGPEIAKKNEKIYLIYMYKDILSRILKDLWPAKNVYISESVGYRSKAEPFDSKKQKISLPKREFISHLKKFLKEKNYSFKIEDDCLYIHYT